MCSKAEKQIHEEYTVPATALSLGSRGKLLECFYASHLISTEIQNLICKVREDLQYLAIKDPTLAASLSVIYPLCYYCS